MLKRSDEILQGRDEVAAFLGWSVDTLLRLANKYPPGGAKINGRWNWTQAGALQWRDFVATQETRHPEARRYRPAEPPTVADIIGRKRCQAAK